MTAARPADTTKPLSEENAREALQEACALVGRDATGAQLIRLGSNGVFRLASAPVIVRVMRGSAQFADAAREVQVSRWLAASEIPAVQVTDDAQPVVADGRTVTFWISVSDSEEYGTTAELGAVLRQLHQLRAPASLQLPEFSPFDRAWSRISQSRTLSDVDKRFLSGYGRSLVDRFSELTYVLPGGPIHGDANVGNLLRCKDGTAVLSDLDGFERGPREWDLILTAMYFERYGWHSGAEYRAFCNSYGFDVMTWDGYKTLADTREFLMVTWLSQNAAPGSPNERELDRRVATLKSGKGRHDWQPF